MKKNLAWHETAGTHALNGRPSCFCWGVFLLWFHTRAHVDPADKSFLDFAIYGAAPLVFSFCSMPNLLVYIFWALCIARWLTWLLGRVWVVVAVLRPFPPLTTPECPALLKVDLG